MRTERKRYLDKDNNIIRYYVINKNASGKISEQLLFNGSNKLIAIEEYEYNESGRTAEWRVYNGNKTLLSYNIYTYKTWSEILFLSGKGKLIETFFENNSEILGSSPFKRLTIVILNNIK